MGWGEELEESWGGCREEGEKRTCNISETGSKIAVIRLS